MAYHFKRLEEGDLDRLCGWLDKPHVKQWWDDGLDHEAIKQKYRERLQSKDVCPYVVYEHEIPFGFIQYYWMDKMPAEWRFSIDDAVVGLDQFIGEESYLGQGHGTRFIREFIQYLSQNNRITCIITEVDPNNERAKRCYAKVGFKNKELIDTPDGKSMLLELKVKTRNEI